METERNIVFGMGVALLAREPRDFTLSGAGRSGAVNISHCCASCQSVSESTYCLVGNLKSQRKP